MSKLSIFWHMIIKVSNQESLEQAILSVNSLQGLYDGMVIGVDEGAGSDELYEVLSHYPNMHLFRLHFIDFAQAMQEVLDTVPHCDYVGRSDGDEVLTTDPYVIRKWLADTRPEAVNCATHYLYTIGWCKGGETYRHESVRIWKYGTRYWGNPVHQYPYIVDPNGIDAPIEADITFNHIKKVDPLSMTDLNIRLMQRELDNGNWSYLWYMAKEYTVRGDVEKAVSLCFEYLNREEIENEEHFRRALWGMSELHKQEGDIGGLLIKLNDLREVTNNHPILLEYIDLAKQLKKEAVDAA